MQEHDDMQLSVIYIWCAYITVYLYINYAHT